MKLLSRTHERSCQAKGCEINPKWESLCGFNEKYHKPICVVFSVSLIYLFICSSILPFTYLSIHPLTYLLTNLWPIAPSHTHWRRTWSIICNGEQKKYWQLWKINNCFNILQKRDLTFLWVALERIETTPLHIPWGKCCHL